MSTICINYVRWRVYYNLKRRRRVTSYSDRTHQIVKSRIIGISIWMRVTNFVPRKSCEIQCIRSWVHKLKEFTTRGSFYKLSWGVVVYTVCRRMVKSRVLCFRFKRIISLRTRNYWFIFHCDHVNSQDSRRRISWLAFCTKPMVCDESTMVSGPVSSNHVIRVYVSVVIYNRTFWKNIVIR